MTLSASSAVDRYAATEGQTVFPYTFKVFASTDMTVFEDNTAVTTGFSVSSVGNDSGGNVTFTTAPRLSGEAAITITLKRAVPLTQPDDLPTQGSLSTDTIEEMVDKSRAIDQQAAEDLDRLFGLDVSSSLTGLTVTPAAGGIIAFDAAGTALTTIAASSITDGIIPTTYMETLLDDSTAAEARGTLKLPGSYTGGQGKIGVVNAGETAMALADFFNPNLVDNPDFRVAQRGTSFAALTASQYTLDRWEWIDTGTTAVVVTVTQDTDVPTVAEAGVDIPFSYKVDVTTAEDIAGADAALYVSHKIEAQNCTLFGHGATGALSARLSFWIKSTKIGTFTVNVDRNDATEKYSTEFTINTTDTWEKKEVTVPGDTSGTAIADDNGIGLALQFMMAVGATGKTSTKDAWNASGATELATANQVNLLDNTSNNVLIAGIKYERGAATTAFEVRPIADELLRCKRHFEAVTADASEYVTDGHSVSATRAVFVIKYEVEKRAAPTNVPAITAADWDVAVGALSLKAVSAASLDSFNKRTCRFDAATHATGGVAGESALLLADSGGARTIYIDANL